MTNQPLAPFSQEAEEAVVGSVLISANVFPMLESILSPEDFYLTRHRHMWQIFVRLSLRNEIMDLTTVSEELRQAGVLEEIGGYAYLIHLINTTPNSMHAEAYARLVERTSTRRKLLMAADRIREAAYDEGQSIEQVLSTAESAVAEASNSGGILPDLASVSEALERYKPQLRAAISAYQANPNYILGVRTGLTDLDLLIDGLPPGITTVAGATGVGKTQFICTVALNASRDGLLRGKTSKPARTMLFSGEMTEQQLLNRILSNKSGLPVRNISRGNLTLDEIMTLNAAAVGLEDNHELFFEPMKRLNTRQIRQRVRTLLATQAIDLLILDGLLQIDDLRLDPSMSKKQVRYVESKRRDAIDNVMNDLEAIGMTYNLPILLSHQINRAPAGRKDKRPLLADLAEASFVEQKSSIVLFLYRESYYDPDCENPNAAEIIAAKNRHGSTGKITVYNDAEHTRMLDADVERFSFDD